MTILHNENPIKTRNPPEMIKLRIENFLDEIFANGPGQIIKMSQCCKHIQFEAF